MKQIVYITILSLAFVMGVAGQKNSTKSLNSPKPQIKKTAKSILQSLTSDDQTIFEFNGVQSAPAIFDSMNDEFRNNSFVLNGGFRQFKTHLTVSMDYTVDPMDASRCVIAGGKWSLVLYDTDVYVGVIFGEISSGEITSPMGQIPTLSNLSYNTDSTRQIDAQFRIMGGTDEFADLAPEVITQSFSATTTDGEESVPATATLAF